MYTFSDLNILGYCFTKSGFEFLSNKIDLKC
jgi:hypothetical protein